MTAQRERKPSRSPTQAEGRGSLPDLAKRINAEHAACEAAARDALAHALEAGRLLIVAKGQVQHGEWTAWVETNCTFTPRTARLYMQVARRWPELEAKRQRVADLPLREVAGLLATPKQDEQSSLSELREAMAVLELTRATFCVDFLGEMEALDDIYPDPVEQWQFLDRVAADIEAMQAGAPRPNSESPTLSRFADARARADGAAEKVRAEIAQWLGVPIEQARSCGRSDYAELIRCCRKRKAELEAASG